jgi:hypothetical protein
MADKFLDELVFNLMSYTESSVEGHDAPKKLLHTILLS